MSELKIGSGFALDTDRFGDEGLRVGIFASPGAGKGYLLGVLLEELIDAGYPCLMVDPESELWTFREIGALVIGGPHGHVPFPSGSKQAIEEAVRFCLESATPVVFDLGDFETDPEIRDAFEQVARVYWRLVSAERRLSVFALTEAHVVAPQAIPRGERAPSTLPAILNRGRKRGSSVVLETQRIADIANAVISHCNVRFVGRIDFEDDFKRVAKGMPRIAVSEVQALPTGSFYVPRFSEEPIRVRKRKVTHGAVTPGQGEVELRREDSPGAIAELAKRIAGLIEPPEPAPVEPGRSATRASAVDARVDELERAVAKQQADNEARVADLVGQLEEQARDLLEADALTELAETLRSALAAFLGDASIAVEGVGYPGDKHVIGLIQANAPAGGATVVLQPIERLRAGYLEQSAQRLVEIMRGLEADEREALLFLIGRGVYLSTNAVAVGLTGNDSGGVRSRWAKALGSLVAKGLGSKGGTGRNQTRENVEGWVRSSLAPHDPTDAEIASVRDRALYVLQGEGS